MHRVDAVGNSPGVHWELAKGIGSLLGWHKGVRQKKTETRWKIVKGNRKACREFIEGIGKLAGNTPRDRRKKTERLIARMPEAARLAGGWPYAVAVAKPPIRAARQQGVAASRRSCPWPWLLLAGATPTSTTPIGRLLAGIGSANRGVVRTVIVIAYACPPITAAVIVDDAQNRRLHKRDDDDRKNRGKGLGFSFR
ncbi:hypothetical protein BHM03_00060956 [Ensete ventricosum]|nr:hypothetical protein BHM03_00060956 [Ensete ventricosum]